MKYELTNETLVIGRTTLRRIRALTSFGEVKAGELGGFVESEANLSQEGLSWVFGSAWVYGSARVFGDAWVSGDAWVYGDAWVSGSAQVSGDAWVSGSAQVSGDAWVSGSAQVFGSAWVSGSARVYGSARVSGSARVYGDVTVRKTPLYVGGFVYPVTIFPDRMAIGCQQHAHSEWAAFTSEQIAQMDGDKATSFWARYKDALLSMCAAYANGED